MTIKGTAASSGAPLRAGAEVDVGFTDLLANGQAVGRAAGMVVFCFGPLPDERARVRITTVKPKYAVAEMLQLTSGCAQRAQPFCPVFGKCGGCQVQHLTYAAQLSWKGDLVRNALARIGGLDDVAVRNPIGMSNPRAYRNKMSLVVDRRGGLPRLGFYRQRSHDLVPIAACPIVMPQLNAQIARLNEVLLQPAMADAFAATRHIVARTAKTTEQTVVTFTTEEPSPTLRALAPALMRQLPGVVGITNSYDLSSQNAILGREHVLLHGVSQIEETVAGVRYRVSSGSFFQVNVEIVARIFDFMRQGLDAPRKIVDLYCGAGTFSLLFAKAGCEVLGVEENPQAIAEARENAALNQLGEGARFHVGRVEEAVQRGAAADRLREAQIVFLDPPRKGSDETTLGALAEAAVANIWYLSCDPATLARDLKFLVANGYRIGVVQPFDMFPQTGHVETLVTLYRESTVREHVLAQAFKDAPVPQWPAGEFNETSIHQEYPDFVIRED